MRAWWSVLLLPQRRTHLHSSSDCSLLCFDDPTMNSASDPDSSRIFSIFLLISSRAWSHVRRWYLPFTSFIGYFRRCECSVMPCSRTLAPLAQCEPRLIGESNTGSWRTHTPFSATCFSCASALPIRLNGSWLANAPAPAATPLRLRNARRSIVRASAPERLRASRGCGTTPSEDFLVSNMALSFALDQRGPVVATDVLGELITRACAVLLRPGLVLLRQGLRADRSDRRSTPGAHCEEEVPAARPGLGMGHRSSPSRRVRAFLEKRLRRRRTLS